MEPCRSPPHSQESTIILNTINPVHPSYHIPSRSILLPSSHLRLVLLSLMQGMYSNHFASYIGSHPNNIWRTQIMKLLIMRLPTASSYILRLLRAQYCPPHPALTASTSLSVEEELPHSEETIGKFTAYIFQCLRFKKADRKTNYSPNLRC
jgi:hypothetical protein